MNFLLFAILVVGTLGCPPRQTSKGRPVKPTYTDIPTKVPVLFPNLEECPFFDVHNTVLKNASIGCYEKKYFTEQKVSDILHKYLHYDARLCVLDQLNVTYIYLNYFPRYDPVALKQALLKIFNGSLNKQKFNLQESQREYFVNYLITDFDYCFDQFVHDYSVEFLSEEPKRWDDLFQCLDLYWKGIRWEYLSQKVFHFWRYVPTND